MLQPLDPINNIRQLAIEASHTLGMPVDTITLLDAYADMGRYLATTDHVPRMLAEIQRAKQQVNAYLDSCRVVLDDPTGDPQFRGNFMKAAAAHLDTMRKLLETELGLLQMVQEQIKLNRESKTNKPPPINATPVKVKKEEKVIEQ